MTTAFDNVVAGPDWPRKGGDKACTELVAGAAHGRQALVKLRVPAGTVRYWEQHGRSPDAPAQALLGWWMLIQRRRWG